MERCCPSWKLLLERLLDPTPQAAGLSGVKVVRRMMSPSSEIAGAYQALAGEFPMKASREFFRENREIQRRARSSVFKTFP
jgi:hypothetical protein